MLSILICCDRSESAALLTRFLKACGYYDSVIAVTKKDAQKKLALRSFALILVDLPFCKDTHELSFLLSLQEESSGLVMAFSKQSQYDAVRERVEKFGIFTLKKPLQQDVFQQFLAFAYAFHYRMGKLVQRQDRLVDKIKEIKLVDKAKCLLIENEWKTEEEAHKYIEKTAMNERVTRKVIALRIIAQYEK